MKSQRRHDLQTNELADAIGRLVERLRPHAQTAAIIAAAGVVVLVVLISLPLMQSRAAAEAAYAFNAAVRSGGAEALRTFLDAHPEAEQAPAARLLLADRLLRDVAVGEVEADDAASVLEEAEAFYAQAAKASEDLEPMARTGLALVTLQRGDLDAGRKALEEVAEQYPQSVAAAKAKLHLDALAGYEPIAFSEEPVQAPTAPEEVPETLPEGAEEPAAAPDEVPAPPPEAPAEGAEEGPAEKAEEEAKPVG
ncbi:MAG: hypothetical protein R6X20_18595 [Phycisphaerae bacterium]